MSGDAAHDDVSELKLSAKLNAFSITVCDQSCTIADIRVQGKVVFIEILDETDLARNRLFPSLLF